MPASGDKTTRGRLLALVDWLTARETSFEIARSEEASSAAPVVEGIPRNIGHYRITGKLGQGGMGVVYGAHDERLDRRVALKTISALAGDETARKRFWREARAAASVNHPNVCQLHEIGEHKGELFLVMELLEGEPLSERLRGGPMSVSEAVPVGLGILAALQALHAHAIIHRDLKPSNAFLTPHGVKLLDFGLARSDAELEKSVGSMTGLTGSGVVVGTPRYMAPEQVTGEGIDARTDLFAAGAILFEMLAGRPAFVGRNVVEILHATLHEQPPALTGSAAVAAVDRVIRRAMSKRPADRPASADEMAGELRALGGMDGGGTPALARALTRLVVLPFRVLRPDPETDFLAFSLPDAIATSLSGIGSMVVRSSAAAARFAVEAPDLQALAAHADVDRVVLGTLLRAGDQLRATVQLVEAPSGTLLASHTAQSSLGDLFRLQDDIARRVVDALALPLGGASLSPAPGAPHAKAYELYLRANELARTYDGLTRARDLYGRCLELDPGFAPAWAHLGRCHRLLGKYVENSRDGASRAAEALRRALELDPRLSVAHKLLATVESDIGQAPQAVVRLLREAGRHGHDPELFAGLVHALRYCGLFEESVAAHREARRLDPNIATSVEQTLLMKGDLETLLATERPATPADRLTRVFALRLAGRRDVARENLLAVLQAARIPPTIRAWGEYLMAWLDRRAPDMLAMREALRGFELLADPEPSFRQGWLLCDVGEHTRGLEDLRGAVARGYFVAPTLSSSPQFDPLRGDPAFQEVLGAAEAGRAQALALFREGGGERLLGI